MRNLARVVMVGFTLVVVGCGDGTGGIIGTGGTGGTAGIDAAGVSFSNSVAPILISNCASCHSGVGLILPGSMNLSTPNGAFDAIVVVNSLECTFTPTKRVNSGAPGQSYIVDKITGQIPSGCSPATLMPLGREPLSSTDIATISTWISEGAPNN